MFYKITDSIKRKEVGRYPQNEEVNYLGQAFSENSFHNHGKYGRIEVEPVLMEFTIHKKSKATNHLSVVALNNLRYKVIDLELLNFLKPYLPAHQYWKINAYKNNEKYEYYILHISESSHDSIDYGNSTFFTMPNEDYLNKAGEGTNSLKDFISSQNENIIQFKDNDDYLTLFQGLRKKKDNRLSIIAKKVVIDASKVKTPIFRLMTHINNLSGYYVSEELKNKIQENNFTGMDFVPITELNKVFDVEVINF